MYDYDAINDIWNRLGSPIQGAAPDDWLGLSVDISGDGTTVAAGAVFHDSMDFTQVGQVLVYKYVEEAQDWLRMGPAIQGEQSRDFWGRAVALSTNGIRLAGGAFWFQPGRDNTGRVRVVQFQNQH